MDSLVRMNMKAAVHKKIQIYPEDFKRAVVDRISNLKVSRESKCKEISRLAERMLTRSRHIIS